MQFAQLSDRVESAALSAAPISLEALPGVWLNSNPNTTGIARVRITRAHGELSLQAYGIGPAGEVDWGLVNVNVFTAQPTSRVAAGFTCLYDFGFVETELQGMIMKGLLVLAQFHRFKDDSKRADYFVREYYALEPS